MTTGGFPRRVLLAVTGLTPQVVTETLFALAVTPEQPWVPTRLRLVTTAEGAERARLSLLDPACGQFHAFCRDYGLAGRIAFTPEDIVVLRDGAGAPLADIRTPEDNTLAADALLAEVRELCADPEVELHVSLAGGRKTMGFFLGYALSLFGRPQDRLSHVLVSDPFESLPEFFFPPARPRVLHTREGRPVHTADARVMLAEIPFVRLRDGLPREALAHPAPFAALVASAQTGVRPASLAIRLGVGAAICGGTELRLQPTLLAWYAWLAECRRDGVGQDGFLRPREATPDRLLAIYRHLVGGAHPSVSALERALREGFDPEFFQQKTSKLNRALSAGMSLAATPYLVQRAGKRPHLRYGLGLAIDAISVEP